MQPKLLGVLVRYADDLVAMCHSALAAREALRRMGLVMNRLGLTLHPVKTRLVDLTGAGGRVSCSWDARFARGGAFSETLAGISCSGGMSPEGDEETPGPRTRVDRIAAQREGSEADHRRTDAHASWLEKLLPDGEC